MKLHAPDRRYLGSFSETQLDGEIRSVLSFESCPEILRASRAGDVLRRFGKVFGTSSGSAATYSLSREVPSIDAFLSHNWCVSRSAKAIALSIHFFWTQAAVVTALFMIMTGVLSACGYLPILNSRPESEGFKGPEWRFGMMCEVLELPIFLFVLLFLGDVATFFKMPTPSVFLDKTCIHQTDPIVQRNGIERLGGFLYKSDKMISLYTETYLTKVWTTYEVGAFVALHGPHKLVVLPIFHAILLTIVTCFCGVFAIISSLSYEVIKAAHSYNIIYLFGFMGAGCYTYQLRRWAKEKDRLLKRLRAVRVQDCAVTVEADREVVYDNIVRLMRASTIGRRSMTQEQAVEAFNTILSHDLSGAFVSAFGKTTFKYKHYLVMAFLISGGKGFDFWASIHLGNSLRNVLVLDLYICTWVFGLWILILISMEKLSDRFVHLSGWKEWCWLATIVVIVAGAATVSNSLAQVMRYKAETSDLWLWVQVVVLIILATIAAVSILGLPSRRKEQKGRLSFRSILKKANPQQPTWEIGISPNEAESTEATPRLSQSSAGAMSSLTSFAYGVEISARDIDAESGAHGDEGDHDKAAYYDDEEQVTHESTETLSQTTMGHNQRHPVFRDDVCGRVFCVRV